MNIIGYTIDAQDNILHWEFKIKIYKPTGNIWNYTLMEVTIQEIKCYGLLQNPLSNHTKHS